MCRRRSKSRGAEAPVGEVELEPGEYHVVAYSCVDKKGPTVVDDKAGTASQLYRTSYAHFSIAAGEIVNVGFLHVNASHDGKSLFGRAVKTDVEVTEWPLAEIERFKLKRPALAAQMKTRLMTVGADPQTADQKTATCARWRQAKTEGLAQSVPKECTGE